MQTYHFTEGTADKQIDALVVLVGNDFVVTVGGGTRHHTGAVAVAHSHPKIKDPDSLEATASVITIPGHKEDQVAREMALTLARAFRTTVTVSMGIHIDNASLDEIETLITHTHHLTAQIITGLKNNRVDPEGQ